MRTLLLALALVACKKGGNEPAKLGPNLQIVLPENYYVDQHGEKSFSIVNSTSTTVARINLASDWQFPDQFAIDTWKRESKAIGEGIRVETLPNAVIRYIDRKDGSYVYGYLQTGSTVASCESFFKEPSDPDLAICSKITLSK